MKIKKRRIAVLFANTNSVYHNFDVDVYDKNNPVQLFNTNQTIIAHPPCRAWSKTLRHMAKPEPGEKNLGLWVCAQVKWCGGILEQPAGSLLFSAGRLPLPGDNTFDNMWTMEINQCWWGYRVTKKTWLCFSHIPKSAVQLPIIKQNEIKDSGIIFNHMSKNQRSETCFEFAKWLINNARKVMEIK